MKELLFILCKRRRPHGSAAPYEKSLGCFCSDQKSPGFKKSTLQQVKTLPIGAEHPRPGSKYIWEIREINTGNKSAEQPRSADDRCCHSGPAEPHYPTFVRIDKLLCYSRFLNYDMRDSLVRWTRTTNHISPSSRSTNQPCSRSGKIFFL